MKKELLLVVAIFYSLLSSAQSTLVFDKQWQDIDSLIVLKNLPQTALEKVNVLYAEAKKKQLSDEVIRALLYQLSLKEKTTEGNINASVKLLQTEWQLTSDMVSKAVIDVLLANKLQDYYRQNVWRNAQRKETIDYKETDVATWSNGQLAQTIDSLYSEALFHAVLLQRKDVSYGAVLIKGNAPGTRPALYDLLAHEALDFYKTGLAYLTQPAYAFKLTDAHSLADVSAFMKYPFTSKDTASHLLKAVQLFQQLLQFHSADADPAAFIDVDLERIEWVYNASDIGNKEMLYKEALLDITRHFANTKPAAEAWYLLAKGEADKANAYHPFTDTANRYGYVAAKKMIEERLKAMPDSCFGNDEMKALLKDITKPELNTQAESVNTADAPFRLYIRYKNIDTLYARVLLQKDLDKAEKKKGWSEWSDIGSLPFFKTFTQALPQTSDYQTHSVEIKADALPPGEYTLLLSSSKDFNDNKDKLATQAAAVSNLAYIHSNEDYFVVNRETGQPLQNVKVSGTIGFEKKKNDKPVTQKIRTLHTDSAGHIRLPLDRKKNSYSEVSLTFEKGNDILHSSDNFYSYQYSRNNDDEDEDDSDYEDDNSHVCFFTDRSIYRPGQTVWYKGIVTTKDKITKQPKLYHYTDTIEVDMYDANGKTTDSQFVQLNEYGSFSGKFLLPQNGLTGEFSIETIDFNDGEAKFNVEEYKRPTFYVAFDTVKGSYRLNDTITLTGFAKAYAGNAVDGAKLTYNIERTASFPYSYLFWNKRNPYSGTAQIADSTLAIDANGTFTIRFAAVPDSSVDAGTKPLFNYEIEVSATDANGETREAKTNLQVAYQAVVLRMKIPETTDTRSFKDIYITTKNNAGENIPATVHITVSPLQTPAKAYRKRLWEQPDQFVMDRETFASYFPYDEYEKETDYHQWEKENAVVQDTFNTASTSTYKLPVGLPQGWYCIEATTRDNDSIVKEVRYVQVYDREAAGLPSPQIMFSQVISNSGTAGDKAQLLIGSSELNVFAVTSLKRSADEVSDSFDYVRLNNNKKQIGYTIQPADRGNVGLYYAFIKHNSFYTGGMQVLVDRNTQRLNITCATYRNKTEPGSKETWTVRITDSSHKSAAAELLTSMYDASLDQFKKQQWDVPVDNNDNYGYVYNAWKGSDFKTGVSGGNAHWYRYNSYQKEYDHIATSASELWEVYKRERYRRIILSQFINPKLIADEEAMNPDAKYYLEGKASGIQVQHMKIPSPGKYSEIGYFNKESKLSEVVVTGYASARKKEITGSVSVVNTQSLSDSSYLNVKIRGIANVSNVNTILVVIDGVITNKKISEIDAGIIDHIDVLKGSEATALYGAKANNGALLITTKDYVLRNGKKKEETPQVQIRKNFNETAFFFPRLHADSSGNYNISFTLPDAVTTWKWMSLAHTKAFAFGYKEQSIITQKTIMVQPNLPRFLREGDNIAITAKISNLSDSLLQGVASLQLLDAITLQPLNDSFRAAASQPFSAEADRSATVAFAVSVPANFTHPVTVKIIAASARYSDGEERMLPVLSNRRLVTESLPFFLPNAGEKRLRFDKLLNSRSATLTNESLTVEYTPNPVWTVVQSLPYLMQFPHECAEQTFNRLYANVLAAYLIAKHPQIKQVLEKWKAADSLSSGEGRGEVMQSKLAENPELNNILLNETPWVKEAESESVQRKNIALLFDTVKVSHGAASALQQLKEMQMNNGAFAWFKGGFADRYITQYILAGIGKLNQLQAVNGDEQNMLNEIAAKALRYLDKEEENEYARLIKNNADVTKAHLSQEDIQYWYARSFFGDNQKGIPADALRFYLQQTEQYWTHQSPYMQAMTAIALNRLLPVVKLPAKFKNVPADILRSLKENAVTDSVTGMYWKGAESGYYWYQSPVEAQALLINAFEEISGDDSSVNAMRQWLVVNKQTNHWENTKATADACFSLLNNAGMDTSEKAVVSIRLGDSIIRSGNENAQLGSGYLKHRIEGKKVLPSLGNVSVSVTRPASEIHVPSLSYGAAYWQYFEDMDKITEASSPLSVTKKLFIETNTDKGKRLLPPGDTAHLKVGDKAVMRLVIRSDRDMEYIQLTDTRAAGMEPVNVLSGYKWQDGLGYYESTKDASTHFFIDHLPKGTYVFDYPVYLTHAGSFSIGMAAVQCMYAPSFAAHSEGGRIKVEAMRK